MKVLSGHSLRARLLAYLLGAIVLATLAQAVLAYLAALGQADEMFDHHIEKMALSLRSAAPLGAFGPNPAFSTDKAGEDFFVQMWDSEGRPIFQSAAHRILRQPATPGFSNVQATDRLYRVYSMKTPSQVVLVAQDMADRHDMARVLALRTVTPNLAMIPLLVLVVWLAVRQSLKPLGGIRSQMASRKADDLSPVSEAGLPEEVRPLIQELNLLFARVAQALDAQKRFVADAAHELRSPLAALKIQAQTLQRADDEEGRERASKRLESGIDRATHLVDQLLDLARQEAGSPQSAALETLDMSEVGLLALTDTLLAAQSRQVDLGVARADPAVMSGHAEALRLLVRNLLDNAVKYTPAGGTVDLSVEMSDAHHIVLSVEDSGPGIAPQERARVLDRFYRVNGTGKEGSGLGLAIVKAIAERHGAQLLLDSSSRLGGLRVRVVFKRSAAAAVSLQAASYQEF